jgi:hypothetical protein
LELRIVDPSQNRRHPCATGPKAARAAFTLWPAIDVDRAKPVFVAILGWLEGDQREGSTGELLPDRQILGCYGKPTEFEHVPTGFCHLSRLSPSDFRNRQSFSAASPSGRLPDGAKIAYDIISDRAARSRPEICN